MMQLNKDATPNKLIKPFKVRSELRFMVKKFFNLFKKSKPTSSEKQGRSVTFSSSEGEAICRNGVIGLEGLWDLYDMWI